MARLSPIHFAAEVSQGKFRHPPHLRLLNEYLLSVAHGRLEGLVVSMPPRHGKSETISKFFPAWYLGRYPQNRVLLASHEAGIAATWGRKARELIEGWGPEYFGLRGVRNDSRAAAHWNLHGAEGGMDTAGVGGSFTGKGAHLFIVDDPIKNSKEALSKTYRDTVWELWTSTIETRAEPGCGFVIVQTRWHEDDLAGRVIQQIKTENRTGWAYLKLPALAEKDDPLGRKQGEALWPERYPADRLLSLKTRWASDEARLGPYWWESLYQQEPAPREGGLFKRAWFRYCDADDQHYRLSDGRAFDKKKCWIFFTADLAVSEKTTADFFALGVWIVTPNFDLLLWDCVHGHLSGPEQAPLIVTLAERYRPVFIAIESVAYQLALVQDLVRKGIQAKACGVDRDKVSRAQLAATRMSTGAIFFRKDAPWLMTLEDELSKFPNAKHDDLVDMTSMAALELAECVLPSIG